METKFMLALLIWLLVMYATAQQSTRQQQLKSNCNNIKIYSPESIRGSPNDSDVCIQVNGGSNVVLINGKLVPAVSDSSHYFNKIFVDTAGNRILINQHHSTSNVSVFQQGKNNKISIIQQ